MISDNTNLKQSDSKSLKKLAEQYGYTVEYIKMEIPFPGYFEKSIEELYRRSIQRAKDTSTEDHDGIFVPKAAIERQLRIFMAK